jgi:uncharacterized membrane protein
MAEDPTKRAEHRWPVVLALAVAVAMYAALPSSFLPNLRWAVVVLTVLLLIPVLAFNPVRFTRQSRWSRTLSVGQALLLLVANQIAVVALVIQLVTPESADSGTRMLLSAAQVWAVNVIAVALVLWEIDRGGPVIRSTSTRSEMPAADIRFPQDEDHDAIDEVAAASSKASNWRPAFIDYLYSSLSNSMAFSASDSMPLSTRAKALMGLEALSGFIILALVIARAVSLLG